MSRMLTAVALTVVGLGWNDAIAVAHHSVVVNFDQGKSLAVTGTIKEVDIRNPHSQITLTVKHPDGTAGEWFIEWSDKNALIRRNVPYDQLRVGDEVTITVSPSRRLPNVGYFSRAVLPGGRVIRDCGFRAFRESIAKGTSIECGD
jgi:hypothetical protein